MILFSMIKIVYIDSPEAKDARQTIRTSARIVFFISILIFTDTPVKVNSPLYMQSLRNFLPMRASNCFRLSKMQMNSFGGREFVSLKINHSQLYLVFLFEYRI